MSKEVQRIGRAAEWRVVNLAITVGLSARRGNDIEDCAGKTDVVVNNIPLQISCCPKSKGEQKRLTKRGIISVEAGTNYSDESILQKLLQITSSL